MKKINHNEMFAELQDKYYQTKNKKVLDEMYLLLLGFYKNYIANYASKRGLHFDEDTVNELRTEMAERTISHYLKRPGFRIDKLSAYGYFDFIKIITQDKINDRTLSLEQIIEDYDSNEPIFSTNYISEEDLIDIKIDAERNLKPLENKMFCYLLESPNLTEKDLEKLIGKNYKVILENVKKWIKEYMEV